MRAAEATGIQDAPPETHPVLQLWHELDTAGPEVLPANAEPLGKRRTTGIAFFPVGSGLWGAARNHRLPLLGIGGVMLLGNNFSNARDADRIVRRGSEVTLLEGGTAGAFTAGPTWRNLIATLDQAEVDRGSCFFTNAYMALIRGSSNIGSLRVPPDHPFERWSQDFFVRQLDHVKPRVVVALGGHAASFLSRAAGGIRNWPSTSTRWFAEVDDADAAVSEATIGTQHIAVAAVVHPSFSKLNAKARRYKGLAGTEAEVSLVRDAVSRSAPDGAAVQRHAADGQVAASASASIPP